MGDQSGHICRIFDQELSDLHSQVLVMGGIVEEQLDHAVNALLGSDVELAEQVIGSDYKVNSLELAIDQRCGHLIVRRQPAACDLRFIITVIRSINDLERIGDESVRIARQAIDLSHHIPHRAQLLEIERMARHVREQFRACLDALARMDLEQAMQVAQADHSVDQEYESILRQQLTYMMEDARSIPASLDLMWSARSLERIGDRVRNVCQYVAYYVSGEDLRHGRTAPEAQESAGELGTD